MSRKNVETIHYLGENQNEEYQIEAKYVPDEINCEDDKLNLQCFDDYGKGPAEMDLTMQSVQDLHQYLGKVLDYAGVKT